MIEDDTIRHKTMAGVNKVVFVIVTLFNCIHEGYALHSESPLNSTSECFGSAEFINMTCPTGFVISVERIILGAKHNSTGCPDDSNNDTSCCSPSTTDPNFDCIFTFNHINYTNYHEACNGQPTCEPGVLNLRIPDQCPAGFDGFTTFAFTEYKCIDESEIVKLCDIVSFNTTGDHLFIGNENFPDSAHAATTNCSCSIEANDPNSNIEVITIHRWLEFNSTHCYQSLSVTGHDGSLIQSWGCADNTQVQSTAIYSNYINIEWNNSYNSTGGKVWNEIRASNPSSTLYVNCPARYQTTTTMSSTSSSTTRTTTVTTTSSTVTSLTTTTTPPPTTTPTTTTTTTITPTTTTTPSTDNNNLFLILIIVVAVAGLLFLLLIIAVCCWCYYLQRMKRDPPTDRQSLKRDNETHSDTGSEEIIHEAPSQPHEEPVVINMPHSYSADPNTETVAEASKLIMCDNSTNTESIEIEHADKDIQAAVSMVDLGCNITFTTESRGTETEALAETVDAGVQTQKTRMKSKRVGKDEPIIGETIMIENDSYEEVVQQTLNQPAEQEFGQTGDEREFVSVFLNEEPAENENIVTELDETEHGGFRTDGDQNYEIDASDESINGENGGMSVIQDINIIDVRPNGTIDYNDESITSVSNSDSNDSVSSVEERVNTRRIRFNLKYHNTRSNRSENDTLRTVIKAFCDPEIQERRVVKRLRKIKRVGKKKTKGKQNTKRKTKTDLRTTGADSGLETGSLTSVESGLI